MSNSSNLSEFLARLNIAKAGHFKSIKVKNLKISIQLLFLFDQLGIINGFIILDSYNIEVEMKYNKLGVCIFKKLSVISKPGKRVFATVDQVYRLKDKSNKNIYIISTSKGLKFDYECIMEKISGEILLKIFI